jgi:teichuronic acid biosynthesis glycosyltransferase TuaC
VTQKLKLLIVHSGTKDIVPTFITEQVESINKKGVYVKYYTIRNKGLFGYLSHVNEYKRFTKDFKPDVIHAHYGLSGLFANLQRKTPVVTTYHGSDIYHFKNKIFSLFSYWLSRENIFVSSSLKKKLGVKKGCIITCGIDLDVFKPINNVKKENFLLFSGAFSKKVKNYPLAQSSIDYYNANYADSDVLTLLELKNNSRNEVALLMNKARALLITSKYEGSSQVLKEAMACNCPVVTLNIGSVPDLAPKTPSSVIVVKPNNQDVAKGILKALKNKDCKTREHIIEQKISLEQIAEQLISLYEAIKKK